MILLSAALEERVREKIRERKLRTSSAKVETAAAAAAAAALGGSGSDPRPQSRNKAAHGGSNRTKAKQAAPSPAVQPEKQPASRMPPEAPAPHRDEEACPQQSPAYAELPPKTTTKQGKGQAPNGKDVRTSKEQPVLQTAQARKPKAAKRKAAKSQGTTPKTRPGASSDGSSTADGSSQNAHQEQASASAKVPAVAARFVTQPHRTQQMLQRPSSHGHPAPRTAPETIHSLQQSASENVQSAGSSSSSTAPDAGVRRPCLPVPELPQGWPTDARPAPVRLGKTALQHSQSSPANFGPPLLHTLLPTTVPQPHEKQV